MTGLRLARERKGWFCTFLRQKSWDRAACGEEEHTEGKKEGETMAGGKKLGGWRLLEEGKAGFAVFRDGSPGIVLSALAVL